MKFQLLFIALISNIGVCRAVVNAPDSISTVENEMNKEVELSEVKVEATMQSVNSNVTTFYPDAKAKRMSHGATQLLNAMAIPQILASPVSNSVTTISGQNVAVYINSLPASTMEMDALKTTDVKKVEYIVFPDDPRYGNNKYVINFIIRSYDYGGYAKFSGHADLTGDMGAYGYVKFARNKLSMDLAVNDRFSRPSHYGNDSEQIYRLENREADQSEVTRISKLTDSKMKSNSPGASFRIVYNSDNLTISNKATFSATNSPYSKKTGEVIFYNADVDNSSYISRSKSSNYTFAWNGNLYANLANGFMLTATPSFNYSHNNYRSLYETQNLNLGNDARERKYMIDVRANILKKINKHHSVRLELIAIHENDHIRYSGSSTGNPKFSLTGYGALLSYTFSTPGLYGRVVGGCFGENNKIDEFKASSWQPGGDIFIQYNLDEKQSISFNADYSIWGVEPSQKNTDVMRSNEFLYLTGNPELKMGKQLYLNLQYTWLANNMFSLSAFGTLSRNFDLTKPIYKPMADKPALLRSVVQNGDFQAATVGISLTGNFFDRSLKISLVPVFKSNLVTGLYHSHHNYCSLNASATYYLKNFYLNASYSPGYSYIPSNLSSNLIKNFSTYFIRLGWSNENLNVSLTAVNFFRKNWISAIGSFQSQYFDQSYTSYSASSHQNLSLQVSYTFGFGKKIKRGDEIKADVSTSSAILK